MNQATEDAAGDDLYSLALVVVVADVGPHVQQCLKSVEAQTIFAETQVIVVDDGSGDGGGELATAFGDRYPNVTVLTQESRGTAAALNRGLREVRAPLLSFLDGADELPSDALAVLRTALLDHAADVAIGASRSLPSAGEGARPTTDECRLLAGIEDAASLVHDVTTSGKLFRTASLRTRCLAFEAGSAYASGYVTVPLLLLADRIVQVSRVVHHRRPRPIAGPTNSVWEQPDVYQDQLALAEYLEGFREELAGPRRPVLDLFLVKRLQTAALRAPEFLEPTELRSFFDRAVEIFQLIEPVMVHRACADARHRVAFVAFALGDWRLFSDRSTAVQGVEAVDGRLHLRLENAVPDLLQSLLVADKLTAHLESIDNEDDGRTLRVRGRFHVDGLPLLRPLSCGLLLRVRGSGITQQADNVRRHIASAARVTDDWSGFVCDLPAGKLKAGDHQLRLVFETDTGQASVFVRPANGALRAARTLALPGRLLMLRKLGGAAVLRVQLGAGDRLRRRWRSQHIIEDLRHARMRRPLWRERLLRLITAPFFRSDIWIVGERRDTAQDNSFVLFRHLRERRRDIRAYYILDGTSEHVSRVRPFGNLVPHSSLRHRLLMLHASVLINSYDLDSYLLPSQWHPGEYLQHLAWRIGSRRVFLQHGVTYNNVSSALHRGATGLDLFVASSQREAEAVRAGMGFTTQVAVTGMPRFDKLDRAPVGRRILVMPTWRRNLVLPSYRQRPGARSTEISPFETSTFATFWRTLLHDQRLLFLLERTDTTLEFFGHYEIAEVASTLAPQHDRVVISHHGTRGVQQAILDCSMFVTDWSSTFFDAAYAGRPLVMAPFDEAEFRRTQYAPGYFDFERDGFGPVVRTCDEAVAAITRCVEADFIREPFYAQRVASFFDYRDTAQCQRVVAAIDRVIKGLPPIPPELGAEAAQDLRLVS